MTFVLCDFIFMSLLFSTFIQKLKVMIDDQLQTALTRFNTKIPSHLTSMVNLVSQWMILSVFALSTSMIHSLLIVTRWLLVLNESQHGVSRKKLEERRKRQEILIAISGVVRMIVLFMNVLAIWLSSGFAKKEYNCICGKLDRCVSGMSMKMLEKK